LTARVRGIDWEFLTPGPSPHGDAGRGAGGEES
jgi:hypothetical protein